LYGSGISTVTFVSDSINPNAYKVLMEELDKILERQFSGNAESRAAGMIINTMGWVEGLEYEVSTCFEKERKKWTLMSFFFFSHTGVSYYIQQIVIPYH
jgi:hypothetical protein